MSELSTHRLVLWRQNPIFAALPEAALGELVSACPDELLQAGTLILAGGSPVADLHVLLSGTVRVFHRSADGRESVVKLLRAPSVFAELEILHVLPMLESVDAVDEVRLGLIPRPTYLSLLHANPAAMFAHLMHLSAAFCVAARNEQHVFARLEERIANLLLSYADLEGASLEEEPVELASALSQADIARSLGAVRRSVTRILGAFQKSRVLEQTERSWKLLRIAALEELAAPIRHSLNYHMGMPLGPLARPGRLVEARLEVKRGNPRWIGRTFAVDEDLIVGRQPPARLLLPGDTVSPQHCRIFRAETGGRFWVEDLDSLNGTFVNDRQVTRSVLRKDDRLRVGGFELGFLLDGGP